MANNTGNAQYRLSYTDAYNVEQSLPDIDVTPAYGQGALSVSGIDVPEAAADGTKYSVTFSDVQGATFLQILNTAGQEVLARIGGASVTGALVAGEATLDLPEVEGERLSYELGADNGGTPGAIHVERADPDTVAVTSYNNSGIESADVSDVTIYRNDPLALPDGGLVSFALPTLPATGAPVSGATVELTDLQSDAGVIATAVLGDPT